MKARSVSIDIGDVSLRLRALTFVCSLAVVLIHCASMEPWLSGETDGSAISAVVRFLGTYTFVRIAVPAFFVMSGFFLAMSTKRYFENLKKRFVTLYIPFVIWNAVNVGFLMFSARSGGWTALQIMEKIFGWNPLVRLGCMQFWYLQAIFIFLLLYPIVFWVLKRQSLAILWFVVLLCGWFKVYRYWYGMPLCAGNFLWLSIGAYVGLHYTAVCEWKKEVLQRRCRILISRLIPAVFVCAIISKVVLGVCRQREFFNMVDYVLILSGLATIFLNLHWFGLVARFCRPLLGLSFFIFAFHTIPISFATRSAGRLHLAPLEIYLTKVFLAPSLSILAGMVLRRFTPKIFGILTGGRR